MVKKILVPKPFLGVKPEFGKNGTLGLKIGIGIPPLPNPQLLKRLQEFT